MMRNNLGQLVPVVEDDNLLAVLLSHLPLQDRLLLSRVCRKLCKQVYQAQTWPCLRVCSSWHRLHDAYVNGAAGCNPMAWRVSCSPRQASFKLAVAKPWSKPSLTSLYSCV